MYRNRQIIIEILVFNIVLQTDIYLDMKMMNTINGLIIFQEMVHFHIKLKM